MPAVSAAAQMRACTVPAAKVPVPPMSAMHRAMILAAVSVLVARRPLLDEVAGLASTSMGALVGRAMAEPAADSEPARGETVRM